MTIALTLTALATLAVTNGCLYMKYRKINKKIDRYQQLITSTKSLCIQNRDQLCELEDESNSHNSDILQKLKELQYYGQEISKLKATINGLQSRCGNIESGAKVVAQKMANSEDKAALTNLAVNTLKGRLRKIEDRIIR
jgi:chromosome segregation ATPase